MPAKITTPWGTALPPAPRHAVTLHIPTWDTIDKFGDDPPAMLAKVKSSYPRIKPHPDVTALAQAILAHVNATGRLCHLFSSITSAKECINYATAARRDNGTKKPVPAEQLELMAFTAKDLFFAVSFPAETMPTMFGFWIGPGVGISSRFAEAQLQSIDQLTKVSLDHVPAYSSRFVSEEHDGVRQHITTLLQRAPRNANQHRVWPSPDDVYLFPSGMATIYKPQAYLTEAIGGTTVLFGMAFMNSIQVFSEFGNGWKFLGHGTDADIQELEAFLAEEQQAGRKVQAIWAEFPANPLLVTPDLRALRRLADKYDVILAIDDTLGSYSNLDVLDMTDMLVTSLTKTYSGYADVLAGCLVLNPASSKYRLLKDLFNRNFVPEFYRDDAAVLVKNSRDYLERTAKHNMNALTLVEYLKTCSNDPKSAVSAVNYPSTNTSGINYRDFMRSPTMDFKPGFGCLFSVEMDDVATAQAFYDNLNVHNGPHLGAPLTLALPYTMMAYKKQFEWASGFGLRPPLIRISAGLEDTQTLLTDFKTAVAAANAVKHATSAGR